MLLLTDHQNIIIAIGFVVIGIYCIFNLILLHKHMNMLEEHSQDQRPQPTSQPIIEV